MEALVWEFTKYLSKEINQHPFLVLFVSVVLGEAAHVFYFVYVYLHKHVAVCSFALLQSWIYLRHAHSGYKQSNIDNSRKPYPCNNERCVAMSKAFLYGLMRCLSKQCSPPRDDSLWDNTSKSPSTHKGILLSPAGWSDNSWRWECDKSSAGWTLN